MGHLAATTFGIGTPTTYAPWGLSPVAGQPLGIQPMVPQLVGQTFQPQTFAGYSAGSLQSAPLLTQIVWQLQQLQLLQQQQLQYVQQLLQIIPAQLQQFQQPTGPFGLGVASQLFGVPTTGHVM